VKNFLNNELIPIKPLSKKSNPNFFSMQKNDTIFIEDQYQDSQFIYNNDYRNYDINHFPQEVKTFNQLENMQLIIKKSDDENIDKFTELIYEEPNIKKLIKENSLEDIFSKKVKISNEEEDEKFFMEEFFSKKIDENIVLSYSEEEKVQENLKNFHGSEKLYFLRNESNIKSIDVSKKIWSETNNKFINKEDVCWNNSNEMTNNINGEMINLSNISHGTKKTKENILEEDKKLENVHNKEINFNYDNYLNINSVENYNKITKEPSKNFVIGEIEGN